ncbi:Fic family protein [Candidatus Woesearchaeota archaeon]|nr:Fic family protein [Candidatus Woesearchaeota archaeon]
MRLRIYFKKEKHRKINIKTDMDILLEWYKKNETKLHPLVLAVIFHHKFEKIHPFMDGNGRTGRILLNYILLRKKYSPLIINNSSRKTYLEALSKADKANLTTANKNEYSKLVEYIASQFTERYWNIFL